MTSAGSLQGSERTHPIAVFSARLGSALDAVADAPAWSMTAEEERAVLVELSRSAARLSELRLRVLAAADKDDVGKVDGSPSTGAWLAGATRRGRAAARADVALALALDEGFEATRTALAAGRMDVAQARVVVRAVDALPASVGVEGRARAEAHLVDLATSHDAAELKVLGRRIFEVVDPDAADEELGRRIAREEREARRKTYLLLRENDDGTTDGRFRIPALHAHMLRKALDGFTSPRRRDATAQGRTRQGAAPAEAARLGRPELLGRGLCELIERFPADRLPKSGGVNATVVVTMTLDQLRTELAAASLDTGGLLSAGEVRRLACEAGIIPIVLGGGSVPLDVGREQRLFTRYQRIAAGVRQRTCAEQHCGRPAAWTEAHHRTHWARGGRTAVEELVLLCPWHHHRAHDPTYDLTTLPDGRIRFHRRT
jgi:hypothetical protein